MTAPLEFHYSRLTRTIHNFSRDAAAESYNWFFRDWVAATDGQLWSRVAEGRKQVWS